MPNMIRCEEYDKPEYLIEQIFNFKQNYVPLPEAPETVRPKWYSTYESQIDILLQHLHRWQQEVKKSGQYISFEDWQKSLYGVSSLGLTT